MRNNGFVLRRYHFIACAIGFMFFVSVSSFSVERPHGNAPESVRFYIALTFDDGPHQGFTRRILEVLRDRQVKATFFVVGKQAAKYPELLQEIDRGGNEIGSHTYTHPNLAKMSDPVILSELDRTKRVISALTGKESWYFRPPGGQYNKRVLKTTSQAGYKMILWTVFPKDHQARTAQSVVDSVLRESFDGGVVLLHSGCEQTIQALPTIIDQLMKRGFEFVTISELVKKDLHTVRLYSYYRTYPLLTKSSVENARVND